MKRRCDGGAWKKWEAILIVNSCVLSPRQSQLAKALANCISFQLAPFALALHHFQAFVLFVV
jgi:hypothetical protein